MHPASGDLTDFVGQRRFTMSLPIALAVYQPYRKDGARAQRLSRSRKRRSIEIYGAATRRLTVANPTFYHCAEKLPSAARRAQKKSVGVAVSRQAR